MNYTINVVIPMYNTKQKDLMNCLSSILIQDIISNVKVIIVDDCSNVDILHKNESIINNFKNMMNIKLIKLQENKGVGNARNIGLQNCDSDLIIFCDSDDVFLSPLAFTTMVKSFVEKGIENVDITMCGFIEEDTSKYITEMNKHQYNLTYLHAKCYSHKFLLKYDIQFPLYRTNEDVCFNLMSWSLSNLDRIIYINTPVHLWRNNKDSITRKDKTMEQAMSEMIDFANSYVLYARKMKDYNILNTDFVVEQCYKCLMLLYWYSVKHRNEFIESLVNLFDDICGQYLKIIVQDQSLEDFVNSHSFELEYCRSVNNCKNITLNYVPSITIYDWLFTLAQNNNIKLN